MITNKSVLRDYKILNELKRARKEAVKEKNRIENRLGRLSERIYYAEMVDEVYKGVALTGDYDAVGDDILRHARIYLNAHNQTTWGIYFKRWKRFNSGYVDGWGGSDNKEEEVCLWAKEWIVNGTLPDHVSEYDRKKLLTDD